MNNITHPISALFIAKLFIAINLLFGSKALGCVCKPKFEFNSKEDLQEYGFIAHIKIIGIDSAEIDKNNKLLHQISIETLEQYKGVKQNTLLVSGPHRSLTDQLSSCSMGERLNEEWIIFAKSSNVYNSLITGHCTRSQRIKRSDGFEHIEYPTKENFTDKVRKVFGRSRSFNSDLNGVIIGNYKNGKIQSKENFSGGALHGERTIWYPNGEVQSQQFYSEGKENGTFKWYSEKGELIKLEHFNEGVEHDTTTYWYETDTLGYQLLHYSTKYSTTLEQAQKVLSTRRTRGQNIFNNKGESIAFISYGENGIKESERYFIEGNLEVRKEYHKNGLLRHEAFTKNGKPTGISKSWDENGKLIKSFKYDSNGVIIKESIVNYP